MPAPTTNLMVLVPSRRRVRAGDIFALRPSGRGYLFGRVIATDAAVGPIADVNLIYIFDYETVKPSPPKDLTPDRLLIPPVVINRLPWSRGYFQHLEQRPITERERLPVHIFKSSHGRLYNEYGRRLDTLPTANRGGPVTGQYGLHSFRTVDDEVSRALGIPLAPG
jgi:Immunity protein 26